MKSTRGTILVKIISQTYLPSSSAFLEIIFRVRLKHNIYRKNGYVEDAQKWHFQRFDHRSHKTVYNFQIFLRDTFHVNSMYNLQWQNRNITSGSCWHWWYSPHTMAVLGQPYLAIVSTTIAMHTWFWPMPPNSLGIISPKRPCEARAFMFLWGYS